MNKINNTKVWWSKENLSKKGSIAKDWACGFTTTLDKYSTDLTDLTRKFGFLENIGQERKSAGRRVLIRDSENNVLLVGDDGVGRFSIIRSITQRSFLNQSFLN